MALMASTVYDALREAGASDEKARRAAEEVVERDKDINVLKADVGVLKWMMGTMIGLQIATLGIILSYALNHMAK